VRGPAEQANIGSETFPPEASLKFDAIQAGYAVPFIRLHLHVWCIDLSIRLRQSADGRGESPSEPIALSARSSLPSDPIASGARGKPLNELSRLSLKMGFFSTLLG
jgi:hypothetical protein